MLKIRGIIGALLDPRFEGPLPELQQIHESFVLWDDEYTDPPPARGFESETRPNYG